PLRRYPRGRSSPRHAGDVRRPARAFQRGRNRRSRIQDRDVRRLRPADPRVGPGDWQTLSNLIRPVSRCPSDLNDPIWMARRRTSSPAPLQRLPELTEALAHFADIKLRLFHRGEMPALVQFIEIEECREARFGPALRGAEDLLWKDRASDRHADRV